MKKTEIRKEVATIRKLRVQENAVSAERKKREKALGLPSRFAKKS